MDRFLTFEGRQPIWLDDFNFMQDAVESDIKKLVDSLLEALDYDGSSAVILSGCEREPQQQATFADREPYAEGVIYSNGKLLKVKKSIVTKQNYPGTYLTIIVSKEYDTAGDRTMIDSGEEKSCYEKPVAALTKRSAGPRIVRLKDLIKAKYGEKVLFDSEMGRFKFRLIRKDGTYFLSGSFHSDGGSISQSFPVDDKQMRWDVANIGTDSLFTSGETIGIAGYRSSSGLGSAVVVVAVRPGTSESEVDITVSIPATLPEDTEGSFTMILNKIN